MEVAEILPALPQVEDVVELRGVHRRDKAGERVYLDATVAPVEEPQQVVVVLREGHDEPEPKKVEPVTKVDGKKAKVA